MQSLVGELRSHMLHSMAKEGGEKKKKVPQEMTPIRNLKMLSPDGTNLIQNVNGSEHPKGGL